MTSCEKVAGVPIVNLSTPEHLFLFLVRPDEGLLND